MKKLTAGIFTVLMGLVSVNAADAAVASKGYVDQFVGENGSITTKVTTLETTVGDANSGLVKDVADLQTQLENGELKINNDAILTDMIKDGQVTEAKLSTELAGKINDKADTSYVNAELDKKVNKADAKLAEVGSDGSYIKLVSQADGKVSATAASFEGSVTDDSTSVNAPSTAAVASYVKGKLEFVTGDAGIAGLQSQIDEINDSDVMKSGVDADVVAQVATNKANIEALDTTYVSETEMDTFEAANTAAINAKVAQTDYNAYVSTNDAAVQAVTATANQNKTDIAAINNAENGILAQANGYTDASIRKLNLNELSRVPAECGVPGKYCVLTSDGTKYLWEVIERGADESQPDGAQPIPSVQQ